MIFKVVYKLYKIIYIVYIMTDFSNFIYEAPCVLDENACKCLIQCFEQNKHFHTSNKEKYATVLNLNNLKQTNTSDTKIYEIITEIANIFDIHINKYFSKLITLYNINHPNFSTSGINITKYNKNEGDCINKAHLNIRNGKQSQFIYIFFLNNIDNGGDICFFNNKTIKAESGKLVLFPTEWFFMHKNNIPISDDKYTLSGLFYN